MSPSEDFNAARKPRAGKLYEAVLEGEEDKVKSLLRRGADPNDLNPDNPDDGGALICAINMGNTDIIQLLIKKGADLKGRDAAGQTPLMMAVQNTSSEIVILLLEKGAEVNARSEEGDTPLMIAARGGNVGDASVLIEHGADITIKNKEGQTALDLAVEYETTVENYGVENEAGSIVSVIKDAVDKRERIAAEKLRVKMEKEAQRMHNVTAEKQRRLKEEAPRLRPRLSGDCGPKP